jgi:hypothetical protein
MKKMVLVLLPTSRQSSILRVDADGNILNARATNFLAGELKVNGVPVTTDPAVLSVNGHTGAVTLNYTDVGAQPASAQLTAVAAVMGTGFGRGFLALSDQGSARGYIGAGTSSFDGAFASLTGKPTTIAGYGITDFNSLGDARWALLSGSYSNPSWITALAWSKLTGTPATIGGYGITDFNSLGDARWSVLAHTHTFASLTSKPTTISGFGITDFNSLGDARWQAIGSDQVVPANTTATGSNWFTAYNSTTGAFTKAQPTFIDLLVHPTTIGGYGITDFNSLGDARWEAIGSYESPLTFNAPLSRSVNAISIVAATSSVPGSMSAADKAKIDAITGTNTGDQVISDATISATDITTNNVSTTKHGFAPKLPNDATKFLNGTGGYTVPPDTNSGGTVTSASVVTANGVSATVANSTTTPAFTFTLGAITPSSVATGSFNLSGASNPPAIINFTSTAGYGSLQFNENGAPSTTIYHIGSLFSDTTIRSYSLFENQVSGGAIALRTNTDGGGAANRVIIKLGMNVGDTPDPGAGIVSAKNGFRINNAATTGHVLRGNGTNFVDAALIAGDIPNLSATYDAAGAAAAVTPTTLGLVIGTNVEAHVATLTSWAAITRASGFDTFTATPSGSNLASLLTTALPATKGGTGLTSLGTGVATWLGTPTFANLLSATSGIAASGANSDITSLAGPALGTPASGVATNLTLIPAGNLTGSIADARLSANVPLLTTGGALTVAGGLNCGASSSMATIKVSAGASIYWNGKSEIRSLTDGNFTFTNDAETAFSLLQLGGTTSSFPAIKRSGTTVAFRLADDSADAPITAGNGTLSGTLSVTGASTLGGLVKINTAYTNYNGQLAIVDPTAVGSSNSSVAAITGSGNDFSVGANTGRKWYIGTGWTGSDSDLSLFTTLSGTAVSIGANGTERMRISDAKVSMKVPANFAPQAAPGSPIEGDCYQSSSDHHFYIYNGTAWKQLDN